MISSAANEKVKHIVQLKDKARRREEEGVYLAEGVRLFAELPEEDAKEVYLTAEGEQQLLKRGLKERLERYRRQGILEKVTESVLAKMSDVVTPQGVLAVVKRRTYSIDAVLSGKQDPLLLLLEDIRDPGNLGTILRTAEAAGADTVVLAGDCTDVYGPKTVRSTMGAVFRLPVIMIGDAAEFCVKMREHGISSYAAALDRDALPYTEADYRKGSMLMVGNEANGLKAATIEAADSCIFIPMAGKTESLNASVSAAVLLYEAARSRGFTGSVQNT